MLCGEILRMDAQIHANYPTVFPPIITMEEKKSVKIVVYENEWAPVRRFARALIRTEQNLEKKFESVQNSLGKFGEKSSNKFSEFISASRKNITKVVQTYPQITLGIVGLSVGLTSRRYNLSVFSSVRNSIVSMAGLSLLCYPKHIVPFLVDPKTTLANTFNK